MLLDLLGPARRLLTDVADLHFSDIPVRGDDGARAIGANDDAAAVEVRGRRRQHPRSKAAFTGLPDARWQRCMVHFYRNVFSHVPATRVREVSHMLKAIHAQESRDAADQKARAIVDDLRAARMNTAADLVERSVHETLIYYAFPDIHWQKIRTNNPLERIMREIRRRTRVVGAFPDGQSCLNLAAARLRYIAGTTWSTKRYMNMRPLYQPQFMQTEAVA